MDKFYSQLASIVSQSGTFERIIILGKGGSLCGINKDGLSRAFIININDSERYFPGHVAIFHSPWVYESIKLNAFRAHAYITNLQISHDRSMAAPYIPDTCENLENVMTLFTSDTFYLTDFLLLSALKLAFLVNRIRGSECEICLLGFDFDASEPSVLTDFSGHEADFKRILLKSQRICFEYVKRCLDKLGQGRLVKHVGTCSFSSLSVEEFNSHVGVDSLAGGAQLFDNQSGYGALIQKVEEGHVLLVAELTNNHVGDAERLVQMIKLAKASGADMIKVQKRELSCFYTEEQLAAPYDSPFGKTLGDYRNAVELDSALMRVMEEACQKERIVWFSSVLDYPSFKFMLSYNPPIIKLPSTISDHRTYLERVGAEFKGDLVVSTGFTNTEYESFVLQTFLNERRLFLLQAVSSYPAPPEICQIAVVRHYDHLREGGMKNLFPGYSSHDVGSTGCMLAVSAGARMIEKHVKLGNLDWVHFDGVALDLQDGEFARFVKDVRRAEILTGSQRKVIHEQEHHKYTPNRTHN